MKRVKFVALSLAMLTVSMVLLVAATSWLAVAGPAGELAAASLALLAAGCGVFAGLFATVFNAAPALFARFTAGE